MKQHVTIKDARKLGADTNAEGIVVIQFMPDGGMAMVSYGRNRFRCQQLGQWVDKRFGELESGACPSPWEEQVVKPRCKETLDMF